MIIRQLLGDLQRAYAVTPQPSIGYSQFFRPTGHRMHRVLRHCWTAQPVHSPDTVRTSSTYSTCSPPPSTWFATDSPLPRPGGQFLANADSRLLMTGGNASNSGVPPPVFAGTVTALLRHALLRNPRKSPCGRLVGDTPNLRGSSRMWIRRCLFTLFANSGRRQEHCFLILLQSAFAF